MSGRIILIVESNPKDTQRLNKLSNEQRAMHEALRDTRQQFTLIPLPAARIDDLGYAIARHEPEIIHFMGHGEGEAGLCFEGENGRKELLSNTSTDDIFRLASSSVKFVFLNACYSEIQAKIIVKHIPQVVGMSDKIPDTTALAFAEKFYHYVGLDKSVAEAFQWAKTLSKAHELADHLVPVMLSKSDDDHDNQTWQTEAPAVAGVPAQPQQPDIFTPNSPLLLIPTSLEYELVADKHYREVEAELDSRWGLLNARRASTLTNLQRELGMDAPNVVYIYTVFKNGQLFLDSDRHGSTFGLDQLAEWFQQAGLRPLLILVMYGRFDVSMIPDNLQKQTRLIWCLYTPLPLALDDLSNTVRLFFERSSQLNSGDLQALIEQLDHRKTIVSECITPAYPLELKVDAQTQRHSQQFRAAMLRIMLGRETIKSTLGLAIQQHLGSSGVFVYAVAGSELSCVFDLPQQIYYKMLPNQRNHQGVLIVNWPLHIRIEADTCEDDWGIRESVDGVIRYNIQHGSADLSKLVTQKAKDRGISAKTGAIVFHWNISVDTELTKEQLHRWLSIWAEMVDDQFGQLYSPEATLVHAMCFMINATNDVDTLNKQVQRFVVNDLADYPSLTAYPQRNKSLGALEVEEIEDFFNHAANTHWAEYFRFTDFGVDAYDLSEWVCEKTGGEFETVVSTLWHAQQSNYHEFLKDTMA